MQRLTKCQLATNAINTSELAEKIDARLGSIRLPTLGMRQFDLIASVLRIPGDGFL
jgi:hypothetical protein